MQVLSEPGTMCSSNCKIHVENTGGGHTTSVALLSPISIFLLFFPFLSPESLSRAIRESKVRVFPSPIASARIPPLKGSGFEHVLELVNTLTNSPPSLSSQPHNALRRLQRVRDTLVRRQSLAKTPENLVHTLKHRISGGFFDSNDRYLKGGVVLGYEVEAAFGDELSDSGERRERGEDVDLAEEGAVSLGAAVGDDGLDGDEFGVDERGKCVGDGPLDVTDWTERVLRTLMALGLWGWRGSRRRATISRAWTAPEQWPRPMMLAWNLTTLSGGSSS
ncbi:uncharacterized protein DS421_2g47170 [Arachis hypogaea]|nr:uncharacterized protein DS421_2g47170 [Arachis hypogaea]